MPVYIFLACAARCLGANLRRLPEANGDNMAQTCCTALGLQWRGGFLQDPMDLSLMEQRLKKKDYYLTLDIFAADMRRICNNARIYNASESPYYKSANRLEAFFEQYMHAHLLFGQ